MEITPFDPSRPIKIISNSGFRSISSETLYPMQKLLLLSELMKTAGNCEDVNIEDTIQTPKISHNGTEDGYLFMEKSKSDGENDTDFDDGPKDITKDEYADLFMLSNNESS
ncbi:hypothetical protein TNCV_3157341 [Trichonephila clavipes]|nr:hypothetical protein TNCV_3157341 [Trichonephila clavipes]